jgi:energy-coupling factor transport system substrate-specific component
VQGIAVSRRSKIALIALAVALPGLLVWASLTGEKNPGLLSAVFMLLSMVPFALRFERRRPLAREIVPIAVMAALAAVGRMAFAALPNFKPTTAIVIITGLAFGPEAGFITGSIGALVSNFFFGQGAWTPWQMFCWGMIGVAAGILRNRRLMKQRWSLALFGMACGFAFDWVMNLWYVIGFIRPITWQSIVAVYAMGIWFDVAHAVSTAVFLVLLAKPWGKLLDRIKTKYGLMEAGSEEPTSRRTSSSSSA